MKVVRKTPKGESRQLLLKEYFLNAYLIAALKRMGEEVAKHTRGGQAAPQVARVRAGS
jgi:hypothetical protein